MRTCLRALETRCDDDRTTRVGIDPFLELYDPELEFPVVDRARPLAGARASRR
jgi:hypothetical protein